MLCERYERKCIAFTADNTPFSQWGEVFVDAAMAVAAMDRLVHHSTILDMNAASDWCRAGKPHPLGGACAHRDLPSHWHYQNHRRADAPTGPPVAPLEADEFSEQRAGIRVAAKITTAPMRAVRRGTPDATPEGPPCISA